MNGFIPRKADQLCEEQHRVRRIPQTLVVEPIFRFNGAPHFLKHSDDPDISFVTERLAIPSRLPA
jgi:hypothetical protein